jgi:hypothetical protein
MIRLILGMMLSLAVLYGFSMAWQVYKFYSKKKELANAILESEMTDLENEIGRQQEQTNKKKIHTEPAGKQDTSETKEKETTN